MLDKDYNFKGHVGILYMAFIIYKILFTNNTKLCNIIIDKGNKYFASILMHAKQKRRVAALLFLC